MGKWGKRLYDKFPALGRIHGALRGDEGERELRIMRVIGMVTDAMNGRNGKRSYNQVVCWEALKQQMCHNQSPSVENILQWRRLSTPQTAQEARAGNVKFEFVDPAEQPPLPPLPTPSKIKKMQSTRQKIPMPPPIRVPPLPPPPMVR